MVEQWHTIIRAYCSSKSATTLATLLGTQVLPEALINDIIQQMKISKDLNAIIEDFIRNFIDLTSNH